VAQGALAPEGGPGGPEGPGLANSAFLGGPSKGGALPGQGFGGFFVVGKKKRLSGGNPTLPRTAWGPGGPRPRRGGARGGGGGTGTPGGGLGFFFYSGAVGGVTSGLVTFFLFFFFFGEIYRGKGGESGGPGRAGVFQGLVPVGPTGLDGNGDTFTRFCGARVGGAGGRASAGVPEGGKMGTNRFGPVGRGGGVGGGGAGGGGGGVIRGGDWCGGCGGGARLGEKGGAAVVGGPGEEGVGKRAGGPRGGSLKLGGGGPDFFVSFAGPRAAPVEWEREGGHGWPAGRGVRGDAPVWAPFHTRDWGGGPLFGGRGENWGRFSRGGPTKTRGRGGCSLCAWAGRSFPKGKVGGGTGVRGRLHRPTRKGFSRRRGPTVLGGPHQWGEKAGAGGAWFPGKRGYVGLGERGVFLGGGRR